MIKIDSLMTAAVLAGTIAGCAAGPRLSCAPALSSAKGNVSFQTTLYSGTRILLTIENLPDPEELDPPGYTYVAWVQSDHEAPPQNIGALAVGTHRDGRLKSITPLHEFELFVTAETAGDASQPMGPPLFWAHKDRDLTAGVEPGAEGARVAGAP